MLLAALAFAASDDIQGNAAELAQKDAVIRVEAQQPVKKQDYLVNEEEYTSVRVATQSAIQGYGASSADSESVGYVLPPVPNSQPVPFTGVYDVAPASISSSAAASVSSSLGYCSLTQLTDLNSIATNDADALQLSIRCQR